MPDAPGARIRYVPGLDGLRGAAVAAVVAFHLGYLSGGYLGVDLFFVLSGFLITSLLQAEGSASGRIDLGAFWGRRARRLLPALGVMLLGVTLYAWLAVGPEGLHQIRWDSLATLFYVANWREIFAGTDYWALFSAPSPLNHTWSLAIEEQFYLVWPLVFVGAIRWSRHRRATGGGDAARTLARTVVVLAAFLGLCSLIAAIVLERVAGWDRVYFGSDTRAFAVLVGAMAAGLLAWFGPVRPGTGRRILGWCAAVSVVVLGCAWWAMSWQSPLVRHGGLALCSVAAGVVVVATSQLDRSFITRGLSWAPLRGLGLISYGVYLYHWPIIMFLNARRVHLSGLPLAAIQVAVTLIVAVASYAWIEQPVRNWPSWRRSSRTWLVPPAMVALAVVLVAATAGAPPAQNDVTGAKVRALAAQADRNGGPRLMVIGNSVAYYLGRDGFAELKADPPLTTLNLARIGCSEPPPEAERRENGRVTTYGTAACDDGTWESATRTFRPTHVIFARNALDNVDYLHHGQWLRACSREFRTWSADRLETFARTLGAAGATLVLVTSAPDGLTLYANQDDPATKRAYLRGAACGNEVLRSVARRNPGRVELVDLQKMLCPRMADCVRPRIHGTNLRPDGTHFKGKGAQLVSQLILAKIGIATTLPDDS